MSNLPSNFKRRRPAAEQAAAVDSKVFRLTRGLFSFASKTVNSVKENKYEILVGAAASVAVKGIVAAFSGSALLMSLPATGLTLATASACGAISGVARELYARNKKKGHVRKNLWGLALKGAAFGFFGGAAVEVVGGVMGELGVTKAIASVFAPVRDSLADALSAAKGFFGNLFAKPPLVAEALPTPAALQTQNLIQINDPVLTDEPIAKYFDPNATCDDPSAAQPFAERLQDQIAAQQPECNDPEFANRHLDPILYPHAPGLFGKFISPEMYARLPISLQDAAARAVKSGNPLSLCKVIKEASFALTQDGMGGKEALQASANLVYEGATMALNNDLLHTSVGKQLQADLAYNTVKGYYPDIPIGERMKRATFHALLAGEKHSTFTKYLVDVAAQKNPAMLADVRQAVASFHESLGTMRTLRPQLSDMAKAAASPKLALAN